MIDLSREDIENEVGSKLRETLPGNTKELKFERLKAGPSVADAPSTWLIRSSGETVVLRISPWHFPEVIDVEQRKAAAAKGALGDNLGAVILEPLVEGRIAGRSYAVLHYCRPLSNNPLLWRVQRRRMRPLVLAWLQALTSHRAQVKVDAPPITQRVQASLSALANIREADPALRNAANGVQERLALGAFKPRSVLMHGDFWHGNILHRVDETEFPFVVIDWRGSLVEGFPFFDLVTFARSWQLPLTDLAVAIECQCRMLECDRSDARSYVLAALGHIANTLDQFPLARFLELAGASLATCDAALSLTDRQ